MNLSRDGGLQPQLKACLEGEGEKERENVEARKMAIGGWKRLAAGAGDGGVHVAEK